jgi:hypothetical protein
MLAIWPRSEPRPRLRPLAAAVALAGLAAFIYPALPLSRAYPSAVLAGQLIPQAQMPSSLQEGKAQSADLVKQYPRDPRARIYRAVALLDSGDNSRAETELWAGLAEEDLWRPLFNPELPLRLRSLLAAILADSRRDEARTVARPVCETMPSGPLRELVDRGRLCEP